jgi:four helix bundle protein
MQVGNPPSSFEQWSSTVSEHIRRGPLWASVGYQKALFLFDLCWFDCEAWRNEPRGRAIAEQIVRSCGSISANFEEGYGRGFGNDYARFLSYAIGSARETQGWYHRAHHLINPEALTYRLQLCDEIIAMLVTTRTQPKRR